MPLQQAFAIMSFADDDERRDAFRLGMQQPLESLGLDCHRVDQVPGVGPIYDLIIERIRTAFVIVADLTGERPNCYYELGFAHALGRQRDVIIALRDDQRLHFDLSHFRVIRYATHRELAAELVETVDEVFLTTRPGSQPDPLSGAFGRRSRRNGRLLMGRIEGDAIFGRGNWMHDITLEVSVLPGAPPLVSPVEFHVHPDWGKAPRRVDVKDGCATMRLTKVAGAFTVGANVDEGHTQLEFDLMRLPGAKPSFYDPNLQH